MGAPLLSAKVTWQCAILIGVFIVAAAAQRITGLGFALIATPVALIFLGSQAVPFVATMGAIVGALALAATWRQFRPRAILSLAVVTVVTMMPVVMLIRGLSNAWASITAGVIVILATCLAALPSVRWQRQILGSAVAAGVLTGVSAALAGLAGPTAAAYGVVRQWGESFVPNLQAVLLLTVPALLIGRGWPDSVPLWLTGASLAAVALGAVLGSLLRKRLSATVALNGTRTLALAGGVLALVYGMTML